jgi:hypothetical protein
MSNYDRPFDGTLAKPTYTRPPEHVVEHIRGHLADLHERTLNLRRDVAWSGNRARKALVDLELAT